MLNKFCNCLFLSPNGPLIATLQWCDCYISIFVYVNLNNPHNIHVNMGNTQNMYADTEYELCIHSWISSFDQTYIFIRIDMLMILHDCIPGLSGCDLFEKVEEELPGKECILHWHLFLI